MESFISQVKLSVQSTREFHHFFPHLSMRAHPLLISDGLLGLSTVLGGPLRNSCSLSQPAKIRLTNSTQNGVSTWIGKRPPAWMDPRLQGYRETASCCGTMFSRDPNYLTFGAYGHTSIGGITLIIILQNVVARTIALFLQI